MSTALMYSFARHPEIMVVDEPFYGFYLKKSGIQHPGREEVLKALSTEVGNILGDLYSKNEKPHLFLKNMAHHLILVEDRSFMKKMTNVFLVRHPAKLIHSFAKVIEKPTMRDIGIEDEVVLLEETKKYQSPIIIDSDILLKNPKGILSLLFEKLEIPFNEKMLSWEAGPRKEDGIWAKYWYANVHKSTGFSPFSTKEIMLEGHLKDLCDRAMPFYEKIYNNVLK